MKNKWFRLYKNASRGDGVQFVWLFGITSVLLIISWLVNKYVLEIPFAETLGMVFDPGHFMDYTHGWAFVLQVFINLLGVVLVGGFLVSVLTNILSGWGEAYNNGSARFRFRNHLLFLGSDKSLAGTIAGVAKRVPDKKVKIVVMSEKDSPELRDKLFAELDAEVADRVVVLQGDICKAEQLKSVYAQDAKTIYIMGESDDLGHDAHVLQCLSMIKQILPKNGELKDCYMLTTNFSTLRLLQMQTERQSAAGVNLVVINNMESLAQQVFVTRKPVGFDYQYPSLDRDEANYDSEKYVHLVIVGMTRMSYALATTAAHIAHYPNILHDSHLRTKITFIEDNIEQEADYFRGHFDTLFEMSHWKQFVQEDDILRLSKQNPELKKGDFLDVEWEFISAGIQTAAVRQYLSAAVQDKKQVLTIAISGENGYNNLAAAMYMPELVLKSDTPILIYQPEGDAEVEWMRKSEVFQHFYPFGMGDNCYDDSFFTRLAWAKETNLTYEQNFGNPADKTADELWSRLRLAAQFSNIYNANYALATLHRMPTEYMAELEHNRWNMEKLLVGFRAIDKQERDDLEWGRVDNAEEQINTLKARFYHHNIAPFADLTQVSVDKDAILTTALVKKINGLA